MAKKYIKSLISLLIIILVQIWLGLKINHPPTEQQIKIILPLLSYLPSSLLLWSLRFISLVLLIASLAQFRNLIVDVFDTYIAQLSVFLVAISPSFFAVWYLHPLYSISVFLVLFLVTRKGLQLKYIVVLVFPLLLLVNNGKDLKKSPLFDNINLEKAQSEVMTRFYNEDSLKQKINFPLWFRRLGYNKLFFVYKNTIKESLNFFDLETVFFQEIHPLHTKSFVIFYWAEFILFVLGLYCLINSKERKEKPVIITLTIAAFINFISAHKDPYQRFFFILFPVALIIALGIQKVTRIKKSKQFLISISTIIFLVLGYSTWINYYDLFNRQSFWFNNRELAYDFIYKQLSKLNLDQHPKINITSLIGNPKLYCQFYLENCADTKYNFDSFNLATTEKEENKQVYAGFIGEFIGSEIKNEFGSNWEDKIEQKNLKIYNSLQLRDSIAYKYGNSIVVAIQE